MDPEAMRALVAGFISGAAAAFMTTGIALYSMSRNAAWWVSARERVAGGSRVPLPLLGIVIVNAMMLAWTMFGLILGAAYFSLDDPDAFRFFVNIALLLGLLAAGFVRGRMTRAMWVTALVAALAYGVLLPLLAG
ncbi:MAG: hypothetical protein F4X26_08480 [Chloroflexi bacterium]|nr:hypothetical protein [Chloroflexota bacterium]MYD65993.1 hypothetical protein [Chloroflexota bacterium]